VSQCSNTELGQLLHIYELDLLSEEDKRRFEMHLYDCRHCLTQVQEFMDVARMIEHDPEARALVSDIAGETDTGRKRSRKKSSTFYRLLIAAVIVIVLAVPVYRYWLQPEKTAAVQTLEFRPSRAGGSDVLYLDKGGEVEIAFFLADQYTGTATVAIVSIEGDTVVSIPDFSAFDNDGVGTVVLPMGSFDKGHYSLTIVPPAESEIHERIYMFRVK